MNEKLSSQFSFSSVVVSINISIDANQLKCSALKDVRICINV